MLIDNMAANYGDTLAVIAYHVGSTYQNQIAIDREEFYNTGHLTPHLVYDGTDSVKEESSSKYDSVFRQHFEIARTKAPLFNLYIDSAIVSTGVGSFKLRIVTADTIPEDEINAFYCIMEDSLPGSIRNFYNVCRALYQFPVTLAYPDSLDTTIVFNHSIPVDKIKVAAFVQDMDTKEILQAKLEDFQ